MSKFSFSLNKLINNLLTITDNEQYAIAPDEEIKPTTVRLDPDVKKFCDVQSEKLGISSQAFISMVIKGVMLETISPVKSELMLMQERFFELFKLHKIPLADIPDLLKDFHITLSILADNGRLLDAYSNQLLKHLSDRFCVSENWLKGQSNFAPKHTGWNSWYKFVYSFCSSILDMVKDGEKPRLIVIKHDNYNLDMIDERHYRSNTNVPDSIKIIVEGTRNYHDGKSSYNFYKNYNSESWSYSKCRLQLKAIFLFCYLLNIHIDGYSVSSELFSKIKSDENLFAMYRSKLTQICWCPDDYIDALETKEPYHTSKTQQELAYVFRDFINYGLHEIFNKEKINNQNYQYVIKNAYLEKICALLDQDGNHNPISYEKLKEIDQNIDKKINDIRNKENEARV